MKQLLIIIGSLFFSTLIYAQQKLEGTLVSTEKIPVAYATVVIGYGDHTIQAVRSNQSGVFEINLTEEQAKQAQWLEVRHIAYVNLKKNYNSGVKTVNFELTRKTQLIDEVQVKSKPRAIRSAGDTTRYTVSQFISAEDRNIGDVLKRMPGIEVDDKGVIKHNGKTVNRMYVDGDQLFQNGYGVGTRTIQPKLVKNVEVIQNHEHKKVKQGVSNSDEVALNLVLQEDARMSWSGEATVGIAAPVDFYTNTNLLSFKKKYKTLNTLQYNSIGENLAQDIIPIQSFNITEPLGVTSPSVPESKYYNNRSFALNTNQFYKWNKNWVLTLNGNIWADRDKLFTNESLTYFLPEGDVTYNNYINSTKKPFYGNGSLVIEGNSDLFFFKNTLNYKIQNQTHHSWLLDNDIRFDQFGKDRIHAISESFEYIPRLKNNDLLSIKGDFQHKWHKDNLQVSPGVMNASLQNDKPYDRTRQEIDLPFIEGKIGFTYTRNRSRLKRTYFAQAGYQQKELISELSLLNNNIWLNSVNHPNNNLKWNQKDVSAGINLDWKNNNFIISTSLPISVNNWQTSDTDISQRDHSNKVFFNPSLSIQAYMPNRDYFLISAKINQSSSDINQAFRNPILVNFRELERYDAPIYFNTNASYALKYSIERPIELFYANFTLAHGRTKNDYLLGKTITSQGIVSELKSFDNDQINNSLVIGASKSLLKSGLILGFNSNISHIQYNQLLNNDVMDAAAWSLTLNPKIEYKGIPNSTISYQYLYSKSYNTLKSIKSENSNDFTGSIHKVGGLYHLANAFFIKASWNYESNKSNTFTAITNGFLDASIRYKPLKSKHNFELNFSNILNKRVFNSYTISSYQQTSQTTPLRGMQGILKYSFQF